MGATCTLSTPSNRQAETGLLQDRKNCNRNPEPSDFADFASLCSQSSYSILQASYPSYKSCTLDKFGTELSRLLIDKADIAATPMDGWGK
jgi:hypothetical protein